MSIEEKLQFRHSNHANTGWETWNQRREIINQVKNKTSSKLRSILSTSKLRRALSTQNYKRNFFDLLSPVAVHEPNSLHPSCSCKDSE